MRPACRGCGKPILGMHIGSMADGCPCNSPRGVNHGLVPRDTCTCLECDLDRTGSVRKSPPANIPESGQAATPARPRYACDPDCKSPRCPAKTEGGATPEPSEDDLREARCHRYAQPGPLAADFARVRAEGYAVGLQRGVDVCDAWYWANIEAFPEQAAAAASCAGQIRASAKGGAK